jgi:hypothetical protein
MAVAALLLLLLGREETVEEREKGVGAVPQLAGSESDVVSAVRATDTLLSMRWLTS